MKAIEAIRAALNEWRAATTLEKSWDAEDKYSDSTDQDVMTEVLAHIDAQAAEIERLRGLLNHAAAALAGYRRELGDLQPCDVEQNIIAMKETP